MEAGSEGIGLSRGNLLSLGDSEYAKMSNHRDNKTRQYGLRLDVGKPNLQEEIHSAPRSPVTVQEWIDAIEFPQPKFEDERMCPEDVNCGKDVNEGEDCLNLGAEARHLQTESRHERSEMDSRMQAMLATLEYDPEDVLFNLGFGNDMADPLMRIPVRFFKHSRQKGNFLDNFLRQKYEECELTDAGLCGYRGLSGYHSDSPHFSDIVLKCLHRIRDATRNLERNFTPPTLTVTQPACAMSFFRAVYSVLAVNTFRSSIQRDSSSTQSILEPESRAFLEGQSRPRRRRKGKLILEKNSVAIDADEEVFSDGSADFEPDSSAPNSDAPKTPSHWDRIRIGRFKSQTLISPAVENEPEPTFVPTRKRPLRIQRQRSVDEDRSSDQEFLIQPQVKLKKPESIVMCATSFNKDSFELEELTDDIAEADISSSGRSSFLKSFDVLRTESAISDSSGFLDGDALDTVGPVASDDFATGFKPIMESTSNFYEREMTNNDEESCLGEVENMADGDDGEFSNITRGDTDLRSSVDCDTNGVISAEENVTSEELANANTNVNNGEEPSNLNRNTASSEFVCHSPNKQENRPNLKKDFSSSSLDFSQYKTYFSPVSHFNGFKTNSVSHRDFYENKCQSDPTVFDEPVRSASRLPKTTTLDEVRRFHKSCRSVIKNMHHIVNAYKVKLEMMERTCSEFYQDIFPGSSSEERQEMKNLSALRRLILLEAEKTAALLYQKSASVKDSRSTSSCDLRIVGAASEMRQLVREQDMLLSQLKEPVRTSEVGDLKQENSQICQAEPDGKTDLLIDIKMTLKSDSETFLTQIEATRRGIEDLKTLLMTFLTSPADK